MLISISTLVACVFFYLFIKAVKSGQYEDIHTPAVRMLFEDEIIESEDDNQTKIES